MKYSGMKIRCSSGKEPVLEVRKRGKVTARFLLHRGLHFIFYILYFIFYISFSVHSVSAQPIAMRDVFAAMPDSIAPLVTKNNRLDCIDYIENGMEARVRNILDEYVTLEALTSDYTRFRTSSSSVMEMKLLPVNDSTSVLCLVRTAQTGELNTARHLEDSNIRFLHPDWSPLDSASSSRFSLPPLSTFVDASASDTAPSDTLVQALRSLDSFHPVRLALSPDEATLTVTLQPAYLDRDERRAITPHLRPLRFRWNGTAFELE